MILELFHNVMFAPDDGGDYGGDDGDNDFVYPEADLDTMTGEDNAEPSTDEPEPADEPTAPERPTQTTQPQQQPQYQLPPGYQSMEHLQQDLQIAARARQAYQHNPDFQRLWDGGGQPQPQAQRVLWNPGDPDAEQVAKYGEQLYSQNPTQYFRSVIEQVAAPEINAIRQMQAQLHQIAQQAMQAQYGAEIAKLPPSWQQHIRNGMHPQQAIQLYREAVASQQAARAVASQKPSIQQPTTSRRTNTSVKVRDFRSAMEQAKRDVNKRNR